MVSHVRVDLSVRDPVQVISLLPSVFNTAGGDAAVKTDEIWNGEERGWNGRGTLLLSTVQRGGCFCSPDCIDFVLMFNVGGLVGDSAVITDSGEFRPHL